jgi:CHAD domain-containing protein
VAKTRIVLSPHDAAGSAAQAAVPHHLGALIRQQAGALSGDVEAIHQLRVATRRLRAALRLFRPYLAAPKPEAVRQELAWLASVAGAVRELDVTEELSRERAGKLHLNPGMKLEPLWRDLKARRRREHRKLVAVLGSARYRRLLNELGKPFSISPEGDAPLAAVAVELARPILRKTAQAGEEAEAKPAAATLHGLRVSVKRSRYALEMLAPLAGRKLAKPLKRLEAMQELLGRYHDAVVAAGIVQRWADEAEPRGAAALGAGALIESLRRREGKLGLRSLELWKKINGRKMEREVVDALKGPASQPQVALNR